MMKKIILPAPSLHLLYYFPLTLQQRRHILKRVTMQWVVPG